MPFAPAPAATTAAAIAEEARTEVIAYGGPLVPGGRCAPSGCWHAAAMLFARDFVKDGAMHRSKLQEFT
jgi:hypothetical protein